MRKNFSRRKKTAIPATQNLEAAALAYLSRYAASEFSLRRTLQNRLRRAAFAYAEFAADEAIHKTLHNAIETIVIKYRKNEILNDAAFAAMKTESARRAGKSARAIRMKLGQKGVSKTSIEKALKDFDEERGEESEIEAARTLARRRKWGPYRGKEVEPERKRKEFAALARAGFSLDVVKRVLGKNSDE